MPRQIHKVITLPLKARFTNRQISQLWGHLDAVRDRSRRDHGDEIYALPGHTDREPRQVFAVIATDPGEERVTLMLPEELKQLL